MDPSVIFCLFYDTLWDCNESASPKTPAVEEYKKEFSSYKLLLLVQRFASVKVTSASAKSNQIRVIKWEYESWYQFNFFFIACAWILIPNTHCKNLREILSIKILNLWYLKSKQDSLWTTKFHGFNLDQGSISAWTISLFLNLISREFCEIGTLIWLFCYDVCL